MVLKEKNQILTKVYGRLAIAPEQIFEDYLGYAERLRRSRGRHRDACCTTGWWPASM